MRVGVRLALGTRSSMSAKRLAILWPTASLFVLVEWFSKSTVPRQTCGEDSETARGWCAKFVSKRFFLGSSVAVVLQPLDRQHFDKWRGSQA